MLTIKWIFSAALIISMFLFLIRIVVYKYLEKNSIQYPEIISFRSIKYLRSWEKIIHNKSVNNSIKILSFIYMTGYLINILLLIALTILLFKNLFNR